MTFKNTGFTLIEVIVASTIGTFIALVAVGTLRTISTSAEMVDSNIEAAAEVRFASSMIARDLLNLYRDENPRNMKLAGTIIESEQGSVSLLTLYAVGTVKARVDQPEGDVYEVEYYLMKDEEKSVLFRRLWPNPDKDAEPGGVLTAIAQDIDVFLVRFFDGEDWLTEWPAEMDALPELVEVNIATKQSSGANALVESLSVNFVRFPVATPGIPEGGEEETSGGRTDEQGGRQTGGRASEQGGGASGGRTGEQGGGRTEQQGGGGGGQRGGGGARGNR